MQLISIAFNPLLVGPFTFGAIIYNDINDGSSHLLFIITSMFSGILPFILILIFILLGKLSSLEAPLRKERIDILLIASVIYLIGFTILYFLESSSLVTGLMFCYALNTAIVWQITRYWKISIHMIGLGGPIVALWLAGFEYPIIMSSIIIAVSISRIFLKAHSPHQVIVGIFLAIGLAYIELTFLFL